MRRFVRVVLGMCLAVGIGSSAGAQEITGSIVGAVRDKSGALIVGANVSVVNADKNNVVVRILSTFPSDATAWSRRQRALRDSNARESF
jgi:hypothetical protein